MIKQESAFGGR